MTQFKIDHFITKQTTAINPFLEEIIIGHLMTLGQLVMTHCGRSTYKQERHEQ